MDESELNTEEFDLEDILREFQDPAQEPQTDPTEQPEEETVQPSPEELASEPVQQPEIPMNPDETESAGDTALQDEEPTQYVRELPREPLVYKPNKRRMKDVRRKLVAGPEKRFYELAEVGTGKLRTAALGCFAVTAVTFGLALLAASGRIPENRLRFAVFTQLLGLLLCGLLGSYQILAGLRDLLRGRVSPDTLLPFAFLACLADGILSVRQLRVSTCIAFGLQMTVALAAELQRRKTEQSQTDTLRKAGRLDSLVPVEDYWEGESAACRTDGDVDDFTENYRDFCGPEKVISVYCIVALVLSLSIGAAAWYLDGVDAGVRILCVSLLAGVPAPMFTALSRAQAILERRLHKYGAVLCGWQGVKRLSKVRLFPLKDEDLFPRGTIKLNGVRFCGSRNPQEIASLALALTEACGGNLERVFHEQLDSRPGYRLIAEDFKRYEGGVGAVISGSTVLAGSLAFMEEMHITLPDSTRIQQAVYLAVDGELNGVFVLNYLDQSSMKKDAKKAMTTLGACGSVTTVVTGPDFMVTEAFVQSHFGIRCKRVVFPDADTKAKLLDRQTDPQIPAGALCTKDSKMFPASAYAVTGAKALSSAWKAGTAFAMTAGIVGLAMMLVLTLVHAQELLTVLHVMAYSTVTLLPGLLISGWTRTI